MDLHVFNPEHDIALAYNRCHLTMPHAAQELRMNLGWIPALWASDGDAVLVDDLAFAMKASLGYRQKSDVLFVTWDDLSHLQVDHVYPWGWDVTIRTSLAEHGVNESLLPTDDYLSVVRKLSSRMTTIPVLETLRYGIKDQTCGRVRYHSSLEELSETIAEWKRVVMKAPWSSSGRGIRYVDQEMAPSVRGWAQRVIQMQGGVMVEPYYNKVKDFAMEFHACDDGTVEYRGLSLFQTVNHVYTGNLLASEDEKRSVMERWIPVSLIDEVKERICGFFPSLSASQYTGPFGVDMMVVSHHDRQGFLLHPCVEVNLRRTMGHVALAMTPSKGESSHLMCIEHGNHYSLKVVPQGKRCCTIAD
jgi:hypothetical protein